MHLVLLAAPPKEETPALVRFLVQYGTFLAVFIVFVNAKLAAIGGGMIAIGMLYPFVASLGATTRGVENAKVEAKVPGFKGAFVGIQPVFVGLGTLVLIVAATMGGIEAANATPQERRDRTAELVSTVTHWFGR